jgi:hypothetical protein
VNPKLVSKCAFASVNLCPYAAAEAALEAVELEGDLRTTLQDEASLNVASVPKLEHLMLRAAKVAERKPPLTNEGAAKLNTLVSRCFSRATALQEMEGVVGAVQVECS